MLRYDDLFSKARNLAFQKAPFRYWYFLKLLFDLEQMTTKPAGIGLTFPAEPQNANVRQGHHGQNGQPSNLPGIQEPIAK